MYELSVTLILLVMLVLIFVISYYMYDYYYYKVSVSDSIDSVSNKIDDTQKLLDAEELERRNSINDMGKDLGNVRSDINARIDTANTNITDTQADTDLLITNINKLASFSSGTPRTSYDIMNFPGSVVPDMNLNAAVNALNGLTIKELGPTKQFKVCGPTPAGGSATCMEIPDSNGDVSLRPLTSTGAIKISGSPNVIGKLSIKEANESASATEISTISGNGFIKTTKLGVGNTVGTPAASLHVINSDSTTIPFKVSASGSDVLSVDKDSVVTAKSIKIKIPTGIDSGETYNISKDTSGNLVITAPTNKKVLISGNADVSGNITVNGNIQYTGSISQISAPIPGASGFTSGPIIMNKSKSNQIQTPSDYMNSPYLIPVH